MFPSGPSYDSRCMRVSECLTKVVKETETVDDVMPVIVLLSFISRLCDDVCTTGNDNEDGFRWV